MLALTSQIKTPYHRIPAGLKLALMCVFTVAVYVGDNVWFRAGAVGMVAVLYALPGRAFWAEGLRALRPFWLFVVILGVWHLVTATYRDGAAIVLMLLAGVGLANLVTMTTRLDDMIAVLRWCLSPLRRIGLTTRVLELAIALVIRFTPVLAQKGADLAQAWRARSTRRAGWRIVVPFTLLAMDEADHVAMALRARGGVSERE